MYQAATWAAACHVFTQPHLPALIAPPPPFTDHFHPTMTGMEVELFNADSQLSDTSDTSDDKEKSGDICRDYLRNVCKRGKRCRYRHPNPNEAQKMGRKQELTFCHDFQVRGKVFVRINWALISCSLSMISTLIIWHVSDD